MSSKETAIHELDPILHQPVRTRIAAYLSTRGETTFTELKSALGITDGNLDAHLKKLTAAEYVNSRKETGDGRPQTMYFLSETGTVAFETYVTTLQKLLALDG